MKKDIVIIGSGPAGMSAAIYSIRAGFDTLVIDRNGMGGGQVLNTYEVDNYPGLPLISGFDLGMKMEEHARNLGIEIYACEVEGIEEGGTYKKIKTNDGEIEAKAVIIATGANHAKLNVKGENELSGMGVSYCATCDGAFFKGKTVAVIGGGDVAVEDAIFLARGCEKVYLVHRRDKLRAARSLQDRLFALPNVEIVWDSVVNEIQGEEQVKALLLKNVKTQEETKLSVNGVFVAVGMIPNNELVKELLKLDEKGYIVADESCMTSVSGIAVAGDIRTKKLRQIVTAVADGANAVTSIEQYLMSV